MPTPLEQYRAWEKESPATVCHIVVIDRGDGSAANRLTLTDKPYRDKGVDGTKYHHTYPAPIHCILSDLVTDEDMSGTRIDDIELANGDGKFDGIATGANIQKKRFTVYRGDTRWSFMETDYPERFVEICRGTIDYAELDVAAGTIRLVTSPVEYKLERTIASQDEPIAFGNAFNVPATLVDSATHQYRFSTGVMKREGENEFVLRDNGVVLAHPGDASPDYSYVDESGKFRGLVQLDTAPSGKMTADFSPLATATFDARMNSLIGYLATTYLVDNYPSPSGSLDLSAFGNIGYPPFYNSDQSKLYFHESGTTIRQFSVPSGGVASATDDSKSLAVSGQASLLSDNVTLVCVTIGSPIEVRSLTLSTASDISTGTEDGNTTDISALISISTVGSAPPLITPDGKYLYFIDGDGRVEVIEASTPGDVTTFGSSGIPSFYLSDKARGVDKFKGWSWHESGRYLLVTTANATYQFELAEKYRIDQWISVNRSYWSDPEEGSSIGGTLSADGSDLYLYCSSNLLSISAIYQIPMRETGLLPRSIAETSYLSEIVADVDPVNAAQWEDRAGLYYGSETALSRVFNDIAKSLDGEYTVNRNGILFFDRLVDAEGASDTIGATGYVNPSSIGIADFVSGASGAQTEEMFPAKAKVTVFWDKRFTVQSEAELAGSVTADDKARWSRSRSTLSQDITLTGYEDPGEVLIDSYLSTEGSGAQLLINDREALYESDRFTFSAEIKLSATGLLDGFGLGRFVIALDDWGNPQINKDDKFQVVGRRVNWSRNRQTLRLFK